MKIVIDNIVKNLYEVFFDSDHAGLLRYRVPKHRGCCQKSLYEFRPQDSKFHFTFRDSLSPQKALKMISKLSYPKKLRCTVSIRADDNIKDVQERVNEFVFQAHTFKLLKGEKSNLIAVK